jgi:hypothetical protein
MQERIGRANVFFSIPYTDVQPFSHSRNNEEESSVTAG